MGALISKAIFKTKKENLSEIPLTFFELSARDIDGNLVNFEDFKYNPETKKGKKAFLIVTHVLNLYYLTGTCRPSC